jgi:hypothetical protein
VHAAEARHSRSEPASLHFTFSGLDLPDSEDPLGIWQIAPSTTKSAPPFAAQAAPVDEQEGLRWHVELPGADREARAELTERLAAVSHRQTQLDRIERRLSQLTVSRHTPSPAAYAAFPEPEAALMEAVAALRAGPQAFVEGDRGPAAYRRGLDKAERLLLQFRRLVQYYARVETVVGARWVALTVVDWSGDYQTTWQSDVTASDMALHLDTVRLAMASRHALLRLVSVVTSGALALAAKAAVPGGQILLLPAVYDYVRDVLEEFDRYAETQGLAE